MFRTPSSREPPLFGGIHENLFMRAKALERQTKHALSNSRTWHVETMLGHGSFGVTLLVLERNPLRSRPPRRIVLKLPLERAVQLDQEFVDEAKILDLMRGHMHIVQQIGYTDNVSSYHQRVGRVRRTLRRVVGAIRSRPENLFSYLGRLSGNDSPALLLEYLENGNLNKILEQVYHRRDQLPNRLLWAWYHCLVSACVGMTYTRGGLPNLPVEEEVPQRGRGRDHLRLIHNDIAPRNIMIGERDSGVLAHRAVPKLALIDFGMARQLAPRRERDAERRNLQDINLFMLDLINPAIQHDGGFYAYNSPGLRTMAAGLFDAVRLRLLDPELRTLLAQSFKIGNNGEEVGRPTLAETFERTRQGMLKPASSYRARIRESDDYIRVKLQRCLYDADNGWGGSEVIN